MDTEIQKQYLDINNSGAFSSIREFLIKNPKFNDAKEVRKKLEELETYTRFKQLRSDKKEERS